MHPRKLFTLDIHEQERSTGSWRFIDDIVVSLNQNVESILSSEIDFELIIWTDSQQLTKRKSIRRYSPIINLSTSEQSLLYFTTRKEPNDLSRKKRLEYEVHCTLKIFKDITREIYDTLIDSWQKIELHADINPQEWTWSYVAHESVLGFVWRKKRQEHPFLKGIKFKPHAYVATKAWDRACRGKI